MHIKRRGDDVQSAGGASSHMYIQSLEPYYMNFISHNRTNLVTDGNKHMQVMVLKRRER